MKHLRLCPFIEGILLDLALNDRDVLCLVTRDALEGPLHVSGGPSAWIDGVLSHAGLIQRAARQISARQAAPRCIVLSKETLRTVGPFHARETSHAY